MARFQFSHEASRLIAESRVEERRAALDAAEREVDRQLKKQDRCRQYLESLNKESARLCGTDSSTTGQAGQPSRTDPASQTGRTDPASQIRPPTADPREILEGLEWLRSRLPEAQQEVQRQSAEVFWAHRKREFRAEELREVQKRLKALERLREREWRRFRRQEELAEDRRLEDLSNEASLWRT